MIIKATRLQAWAPAGGGGGGARLGRCHPPENKKKILGYVGALLLLFLHMGAFLLRFSHFVGLFTIGGLSAIFYFMVKAFFGLTPPPTKISASAHDCKEGSRACSPEIFLCGRNLVSSGPVFLRFCLKNDKNNDKL